VSTSRSRPYKRLRDQQPVRDVTFAERKVVVAALRLPGRKAALQVVLDAGGGLVALLGRLGEQLHDNPRELRRNGLKPLARRQRFAGDVAMHPLHRIGCSEWQNAGEHLVEGDAERIEIAAEIDRPVHPTRLFGGHVGECPGDHLRRRRGLALAWQTRGNAKAHEPGLAG
jgi:hypothetical protein